MEKKYTKGPWSWKVQVGYSGDKEYRLSPILNTDTTEGTPWGDRVDRANAHLIAAAPDLLEALEGMIDAYKRPYEVLCCNGLECGCRGSTVYDLAEHHARAAIRKAYGEGV